MISSSLKTLANKLSPLELVLALSGSYLFLALVKFLFKQSPYKGLPTAKVSKILGYQPAFHDPYAVELHCSMSKKYGQVVRLPGGLIARDALYITDPMALQEIVVRNTDTFPESIEFRGMSYAMNAGEAVNSTKGKEHAKQRRVINPVFTVSNIAKFAPLFHDIAKQAADVLRAKIDPSGKPTEVNLVDTFSKLSLECITQAGVGISLNAFHDTSPKFKEFSNAVRNIVPAAGNLWPILSYLEGWKDIKPDWLRAILLSAVDYVPWKGAREFKSHVDTMHPLYASIYHQRKEEYLEGMRDGKAVPGAKDLATLLVRANVDAEDKDRMEERAVIANVSSFITAGQETTSTALSAAFLNLSQNLGLQQRLREEIMAAQAEKQGDLTYEELSALPLLDAFTRETLRVYAPVKYVWRDTMKDTMVPLQFPIKDPKTGKETRQLFVKEGTRVYVGIGSSNTSVDIWGPDAEEFKPERWLNKKPETVTLPGVKTCGIYSQLLTFVGGVRSCPGLRFAIHEIKAAIAVMLPIFEVSATDKEIVWKHRIAILPFVKGEEDQANLPVKLRLLSAA